MQQGQGQGEEEEEESSQSVQMARLRSLLGRTFRAKLSDGREVVGAFKCMDGNGNFILSSALETRNGTQRHLGLVMVPGKHLVKMEVGQTADRKDDVLEAADVRQEGIATS